MLAGLLPRCQGFGMDHAQLAADQLRRMRGMTRYYHSRFFSDIRFSTAVALGLFVVGWWQVPEAFLLIPFVALLGAATTAFDASYLIFARHYAARLERSLNEQTDRAVLIAAELEDAYLFPLDETKVVTAAFGKGFSWFGFMTLFYTAFGIGTFGFGVALGLPVLDQHARAWTAAYLLVLFWLTLIAIVAGWWWFVAGTGERRLKATLDRHF